MSKLTGLSDASDTTEFNSFTHWELNAFLVTSMLAGVLLNLIVVILLPRLVAPLLELPRAVWSGFGFLVLMLSLYPALRTQARFARPARVLSWQRYITACVAGSLVGGLLHALLQT